MRQFLFSVWVWLTTSKYTRFLEEEIIRLRKDNHDLVNALLSASHLPMLPREDTSVAPPRMKPRVLPSQWRSKMESFTGTKEGD